MKKFEITPPTGTPSTVDHKERDRDNMLQSSINERGKFAKELVDKRGKKTIPFIQKSWRESAYTLLKQEWHKGNDYKLEKIIRKLEEGKITVKLNTDTLMELIESWIWTATALDNLDRFTELDKKISDEIVRRITSPDNNWVCNRDNMDALFRNLDKLVGVNHKALIDKMLRLSSIMVGISFDSIIETIFGNLAYIKWLDTDTAFRMLTTIGALYVERNKAWDTAFYNVLIEKRKQQIFENIASFDETTQKILPWIVQALETNQ